MNWYKNGLRIMLCVALLALASGCTGDTTTGDGQVIRYNLGTEPETLDPAMMTGIPEFTVLLQLQEGLTRIAPDGTPSAGIAESWDIEDDGLRYVFYLREANWSNGEPITAYDFEYAWKRVLNPETGAYYAYQLYYLKNGEAYNSGQGTADEVGVRALDEHTLEVELEAPCAYFLSLTAFQTYFPVPQSIVEANPEWWASADTFVGNGPFVLEEWEHHSRIVMKKNPEYWDHETVKLSELIFYMVEESSTELTMFETGEIDFADNPPLPDLPRLREEEKLGVTTLLGTYYYMFNTDIQPLDDVRVRKALSYAIDRQAIVENVTGGGEVPAMAYVPYGLYDNAAGADYRQTGGMYFEDHDVEQAQRLLEEAGYPGGEGFPSLQILYNTHEAHKSIAEAIQEMWRESLGITNTTLANQEWGVYLRSRTEGDYEIARAGWLGDYMDPMTFLDMWITDGGNNSTFWGDPEYDSLIVTARTTRDVQERFDAMHRMEEILMDNMPIAPIYYYVNLWCKKDYVMDVFMNPLGPKDFKWAWVADE